MKFISRYGHTLGLSLILLVFVLAKLPDLPTPYFWDELGVYARGALNMKDTGHFSLLPSAMDPELSRGHPLLSYLGYALAFKLFGDTPVVGHSFTLLLAATALLTTYLFARRAIGRSAALIAIAVLAVQPLFYAMAGIIMPEMMLTLFSIGAMWGLLSRRWWLYLISAICCVINVSSGCYLKMEGFLFRVE
jgi:4-amino-4-deoxy-L-arabinose transferase-like glycosyltransferase